MARIRRLSPEEVDPETRELFRRFLAERGNIPNMFRTAAHSPELLKTMLAHFRAVLAPAALPTALKEMLAVRVSHLNGCHY